MGSPLDQGGVAQFPTPAAVAVIALTYGLVEGLMLAVLFALLTDAWIPTFPETEGRSLEL